MVKLIWESYNTNYVKSQREAAQHLYHFETVDSRIIEVTNLLFLTSRIHQQCLHTHMHGVTAYR